MQDMLDRQAYIDQNMQKKSPFDSGIMRAVKSAKSSLGMDEEQSDRATRNSLLSFSDALAQDQAPVGKGFMGKFAAAGRAMSPALKTYDQYEDLAKAENMQLSRDAQNFRSLEEAKIAKMEQEAYMREMNAQKMALEQERLGEMRDYHKQILDAKTAAANKNSSDNMDKNWLIRAKGNDNSVRDIATSYQKTSEILPNIDEFKKLLKNTKLSGASFTDAARRYVARATGQDEDVVNAKNLGQFYIEWMAENSKGALSDRDMVLYTAGFADIEKNRNGAIKVLDRLENKLKKRQQLYSKQLSLYEKDPGANLFSKSILDEDSESYEGYVPIYNPRTNEFEEIHPDDVEAAIKKGWEVRGEVVN